jgi:hypothetical protein
MWTIPKNSVAGTLLMSLFLLVSCGSSSTAPTPPPGIQPEIINVTDSFEYQIQDVSSYSGTASYSWENTGTVAAIDHSSVVGSGVGTVVVTDADGTEVYNGTLVASGSFVSQSGTAGTWNVKITYDTFSGTVNFRVQKG